MNAIYELPAMREWIEASRVEAWKLDVYDQIGR